MDLKDLKFALNTIQWINVKSDPSNPRSEDLWRFADPAFREEYPGVLRAVKESGFDAVMLEVLDTQTLQNYEAMIDEAGLVLAPGYVAVPYPPEHGETVRKGTREWVHLFDGVRRRAEESNYFGLPSVFLAPEIHWGPLASRTQTQAAVGYDFRQNRLDEVVELLATAAEVLKAEGVQAGLHNHVGTWVETETEIDYVLSQVDSSVLGASLDLGHLEWAGVDAKRAVEKWGHRLLDLHIKDLDLDIAASSRLHPRPYKETSDEGIFREPGLGQIDLRGALQLLPDTFAGWIIVEVDRATMDPEESAIHSAQWIHELQAR